MLSCLDRLGLNPLARDKAKQVKKSEEKPLDEFEQFMQRGPAIVPFPAPEVEEEESSEGRNSEAIDQASAKDE
jgi:hypothetical protein